MQFKKTQPVIQGKMKYDKVLMITNTSLYTIVHTFTNHRQKRRNKEDTYSINKEIQLRHTKNLKFDLVLMI